MRRAALIVALVALLLHPGPAQARKRATTACRHVTTTVTVPGHSLSLEGFWCYDGTSVQTWWTQTTGTADSSRGWAYLGSSDVTMVLSGDSAPLQVTVTTTGDYRHCTGTIPRICSNSQLVVSLTMRADGSYV